MDAPPIQYATTPDGLQIAYWTLGEGPVVLWSADVGFAHAGRVVERPELSDAFSTLSSAFKLVVFDPRNHGLSSRGTQRLSITDHFHDIEAVATAIGADEFSLFGFGQRAKVTVEYAFEHPGRVRELILVHPVLGEITDQSGYREIAAVYPLAEINWEAFTDVAATLSATLADPELVRWTAEWMRASVTADDYRHTIAALSRVDVSDRLRDLPVPIQIMVADTRWLGVAEPRRIASLAPTARVQHLDVATPVEMNRMTARAIVDRLGGGAVAGGFQTILFTDLEASTALTQRLGDEGAQALLRGHNATVRGALEANEGREVKHTGDGIMASFPSAVGAVAAALAIQGELAGGEVRVRIGLNAGEPIAEEDDLFGTAVQLAARVTDRAEPGQVLVTRVVADLCAGKTFRFASIGEVSLKGFDGAVELFEVGAGETDA